MRFIPPTPFQGELLQPKTSWRLLSKLEETTGVQLELYEPPADNSTVGPVTRFVKTLLRPDEFRRIRGLCGHMDELITTIHRDRKIRREYWALRKQGVHPGDAYYQLGKKWHLAEDTVQQIVYPRRKK